VNLEPRQRLVVRRLRRRVEALLQVVRDTRVVLEPGLQPAGREAERGQAGLAAGALGPRRGVGLHRGEPIELAHRGREALDLGAHQLADDEAIGQRRVVEPGRAGHEVERPRGAQVRGHQRLAGHDRDEAIEDDAALRQERRQHPRCRPDTHQNACPMLKWIA
jgi:hypothetical protein